MDAVKRREARRKRILESSEDRFKRIERLKMRSQDLEEAEAPCDSGNVGSPVQSSLDDPSKSIPEANMLQPSERALTRQTRNEEEDSQTHSTKASIPSFHASGHYSCHHVDRKESQDNRAETFSAPAEVEENTLPRDISQDSGFVDGASSTQSRTQPCDQKETQQHQSKAVEMSTQSVVSFQTLVFTLLAVVTRLWLVTLFPGQSIIVLFFATKVLFCFIGLEQSLVQSGPVRMITALLTFRGVSPETVQRIQRCFGFLQGTLRDFSTFLFVFVMVHVTIEWSSSPDLDQEESVSEV